jgi:crotonobetainyl-CoA:carnitine CoA-transferase CaiB-like acyl-CoA transferase
MNDKHMHERGMLEWFDDKDLGRVVLPHTPLVIHGADRVKTIASPDLGQHNKEIYSDWLGLSEAELDALYKEGVI